MYHKIEMMKIAEKVVRYGVCFCLFTPLFVGKGFLLFPFIFPKTLLFQIIVEVIFPFWLILVFSQKERLRFSPLTISVFALISILFTTSIFGLNFQKSLFSTQERMTGIFTFAHFFVFFLLLNVFKSKEDWIGFFKISVIASFLVSLSALYQKLNPDFLGPVPHLKIYGTQGNSIFLSVYLLFNLFLALFLYLKETKNKNWWLGIFLTNLITFFFAASLSAYLALVFGGITLFCFNIKKFRWKSRLPCFIIGFLILFCFFIFFYQGGIAFQKLNSLFSPQSSLLDRIDVWKIGIQGFLEKPLWGFGWENFDLVFDKFYKPEFFTKQISIFDKAHNVLVDFLALSGIFGVLAYLAIFVSAFFALKNHKNNYGIFAAILISYFTINFFNFDTFSSWLMFFLALGYINYFQRESAEAASSEVGINTNLPAALASRRRAISVNPRRYMWLIIVIPAILFVLNFNIQSGLANFYAHKTLKSIRVEETTENFKKSEAHQTFDQASLRGEIADFLAKTSRGSITKDFLKIYEFLESPLKENLEKEPKNPDHYLKLGVFYRNWGKVDKTKLDKAEEIFKKALKQNPKKQSFYFLLAQTKILKGEHQEAVSFAKAGVELCEKSSQAHFYLGLAELFSGDEINFKKEVQRSEELKKEIGGREILKLPKTSTKKTPLAQKPPTGFSFAAEYYIEIFDIYWPTEDWEKIIILADEISDLNSDSYLHEYLAGLYKELGETEKAKKEAEWVMENYPELKAETLRFLKTLEIGY